jgi:hypothetical protein
MGCKRLPAPDCEQLVCSSRRIESAAAAACEQQARDLAGIVVRRNEA